MSHKVKTPWYKRIYGFLKKHLGGTLTRFLLSIFGVYFLVFVIVIVIGVATKGEVGGGVDSTTTYSESSTVVPVYTRYSEGTEDFNKVIADLEFYNTKPEKTEVTRFVMTSVNKGYDRTYSLIDNKDAESLYYHTSDYVLLPFEKTFQSLLGVSDEDKKGNKGTLIFYNKSERTYSSKPIEGMKLTRKSSKGEAESYYAGKYVKAHLNLCTLIVLPLSL